MSSRAWHCMRCAAGSALNRTIEPWHPPSAILSPNNRVKRRFHRDFSRQRTFFRFTAASSDSASLSTSSGATGSSSARAVGTAGQEEADAKPSSKSSPRVCILGGGFGGLYTAVKLDELMWPTGTKPEVTLVDQNERFVFKPLLYEILTGAAEEFEVAPLFRDLLEPFQTRFVQARVVGVNVATEPSRGGSVVLSDGRTILYDWLVIAIGAKTNFRGVPGVMEHAIPFCSYTDVQQILSRLGVLSEATGRESCAVVVGGGYAGVELAAALSAKIRQLTRGKSSQTAGRISVTLITDTETILPAAPVSQRRAAEKDLSKRGVEIKTGFLVESIREGENGDDKVISLVPASKDNGREATRLEADLAMWTAGSSPATSNAAGQQAFPFERTAFGSLRTVRPRPVEEYDTREPTLRLVHQDRVFALGDDAFVEDPKRDIAPQYPATAQVAFQQADYVAWNLWAGINNRPLLPFRYQHLGDMMSLGVRNAAIALPFALPKPFTDAIKNSPLSSAANLFGLGLGEGEADRDQRLTVDGPIAALLRRMAYWYRQPTNEQKTRIARTYFEKVARRISSTSQKRN